MAKQSSSTASWTLWTGVAIITLATVVVLWSVSSERRKRRSPRTGRQPRRREYPPRAKQASGSLERRNRAKSETDLLVHSARVHPTDDVAHSEDGVLPRKADSHGVIRGHGKPQRNFRIRQADNSRSPFKHLVAASSVEGEKEGITKHPYGHTIHSLLLEPSSPPEHLFNTHTTEQGETKPPPFGQAHWVDTKEALHALARKLLCEREIAVDTEQHSLHSFLGFTALMQISTRDGSDYVIDAIALHDELPCLRPVFCDPKILKVFHGADSDVLWLQRDFHIYPVNLFDTARACTVLKKPHRSLAYLLQEYCQQKTDKRCQLADWRTRPLPRALLEYAQTDTHFLLFIADRLREELLREGEGSEKERESEGSAGMQNGAPASVASWTETSSGIPEKSEGEVGLSTAYEACLRRSNALSLQLYEQDQSDPRASAPALLKTLRGMQRHRGEGMQGNGQQHFDHHGVLEAVLMWRDRVARAEDESIRYVLSDDAICLLALALPARPQELFQCVSLAHGGPEGQRLASLGYTSAPEEHVDRVSWVVRKQAWELCALLAKFRKGDMEEAMGVESLMAMLGGVEGIRLGQGGSSAGRHGQGRTMAGVIGRHLAKGWLRQANPEQARKNFIQKFSCRGPVYENCRIYSDEGRLLCFCDRRKVEWYVSRGLAELFEPPTLEVRGSLVGSQNGQDTSEGAPAAVEGRDAIQGKWEGAPQPICVRLLFKPKGTPDSDGNEFYIQSKSNRCVSCGESSHFLRYRLVPSCYRQHFPESLKSHRSHDIVLLCVDCHETAHREAERHKHRVAKREGVPLMPPPVVVGGGGGGGREKDSYRLVEGKGELAGEEEGNAGTTTSCFKTDPGAKRVITASDAKRAAVAIVKHREGMPEGRLRELMGDVEAYLGRPGLTVAEVEGLLQGLSRRRRYRGKEGVREAGEDSEEIKRNGYRLTEQRGGVSLQSLEDVAAEGMEAREEPPTNMQPYGCTTVALRPQAEGLVGSEWGLLRGHKEHGRRVVALLTARGGEHAIKGFISEWRQVFVDALRPRFLPSGWDVHHSGKREFGDFSVYNPERRLPEAKGLKELGVSSLT